MKATDKAKQKMLKRRLKKVKKYYNSFFPEDKIVDKKGKIYILMSKHRLEDEYYFVVEDETGELFLRKIIYGETITSVNVSKGGMQYSKNKQIFDTWFIKVQNKQNY